MKLWTPAVLFAFLWASATAAYADADMQALLRAKGSNGIVRLSDENFEKVLYGDRDYDLVVFMTSNNPQLNCLLCTEFEPHFTTVANSFAKMFPEGVPEGRNVYFFTSDFTDSRKLFQVMKLDQIPKVFHIPPSKPGAAAAAFLTEKEEYQFYQGDHTHILAQWVQQITGHKVDIFVPVDYSRLVFNAVATFSLVLLVRKFRTQAAAVGKSTFLWGSLSLVLVLLCISGYMFNQIRGTPFVRETGQNVEFVAPSSQMQYGLETQIVSSLYGLIGLFFVVLTTKVAAIKNAKVQFIATVIVSLSIFLLYSMYLNVFSVKNRGYPYVFMNLLGGLAR